MNNDLKVGDKVITYDGKFEGEVIDVYEQDYYIRFNQINRSYYYIKKSLIWDGWSSVIREKLKVLEQEGLERIIPLDQYKDEEETIELYVDDEGDYDE